MFAVCVTLEVSRLFVVSATRKVPPLFLYIGVGVGLDLDVSFYAQVFKANYLVMA